jgi:hypothetical protein
LAGPDLVINYSLLAELTRKLDETGELMSSALKAWDEPARMGRGSTSVTMQVGRDGQAVGIDGPGGLGGALASFSSTGERMFGEGLTKVNGLAGVFRQVAEAWDKFDADIAADASQNLARLVGANWYAQKQAYDEYTKLVATGKWDPTREPPPRPSDTPPTTLPGMPGSSVAYDDHGRLMSATTWGTTPTGETYTSDISYTYNGDGTVSSSSGANHYEGGSQDTVRQTTVKDGVQTVITTSEQGGETTTSTVTAHPDCTYTQQDVDAHGAVTTTTVTRTDGHGPPSHWTYMKTVQGADGSTTTYHGDPKSDTWESAAPPLPGTSGGYDNSNPLSVGP